MSSTSAICLLFTTLTWCCTVTRYVVCYVSSVCEHRLAPLMWAKVTVVALEGSEGGAHFLSLAALPWIPSTTICRRVRYLFDSQFEDVGASHGYRNIIGAFRFECVALTTRLIIHPTISIISVIVKYNRSSRLCRGWTVTCDSLDLRAGRVGEKTQPSRVNQVAIWRGSGLVPASDV